ncbi:hypothetical protein EIP91_003313 [Steccherinum ochraceum]|uniref:Uncharacterized protein n=1 Tax=Steccherinum ochraceum TaxID=92696 RepID=A0A4R0RRG2_9APHY|nr:hypothetical protein EIP91_003313 [Steccherinum ochraceum]
MQSDAIQGGNYMIVNHQREGFVFRHPMEDRSRAPKRVYALYPGVQPSGNWKIDKTDKGLYVLTANGGTAGYYKHEDGTFVFAFLDGPLGEDARPVDWKITKVDTTEGRTGYIVTTKLPDGQPVGWTLSGAAESTFGLPIAVRPLVSTRTEPPQYLPSEVFEFTYAHQ